MKTKNSGFTLIEIILSIVVFTLGVVGIMVVFYNTLGRTSNPILRHKAIEVASSVIDEILSKKFDNDTPNGGGRAKGIINIGKEESDNDTDSFDDVDDFNGLDCYTGTKDCFEDVTPGYEVKITVKYAKLDGKKIVATDSKQDFKLIIVTVKPHGLSETYTLKAVKGNF